MFRNSTGDMVASPYPQPQLSYGQTKDEEFRQTFSQTVMCAVSLAKSVDEALYLQPSADPALLDNLKQLCNLIESIPVLWLDRTLKEVNSCLHERRTTIIRIMSEVWLARYDPSNNQIYVVAGLRQLS